MLLLLDCRGDRLDRQSRWAESPATNIEEGQVAELARRMRRTFYQVWIIMEFIGRWGPLM